MFQGKLKILLVFFSLGPRLRVQSAEECTVTTPHCSFIWHSSSEWKEFKYPHSTLLPFCLSSISSSLFLFCSLFPLLLPVTPYSSSSSISPSHLFLNVSLWRSRPCQSHKSQLCICPSHLIKVLFVPVKTQAWFHVNVSLFFWVARIPVNNLLPCILQIILPVRCPSCFNHCLEWMIWCTAGTDCYKVDLSLNQGWMHACKNSRRLRAHNASWPTGQIVSTCYFVSCCFSFWQV